MQRWIILRPLVLFKAKAKPTGSISPSGKYKKAPSGKWLPIKKERGKESKLSKRIGEAYDWIFKETGNKFEAMVILGTNGEIISTKLGETTSIDLTDVKHLMRDKIFLHNHPIGMSFSFNDIGCALRMGMKEIRAVGNTFEYVYRPAEYLPKLKENAIRMGAISRFLAIENRKTYDKYQPKVDSGVMAAEAASMNHNHEIMINFVKEFGGFYERRER